jgi:hypothetical protein
VGRKEDRSQKGTQSLKGQIKEVIYKKGGKSSDRLSKERKTIMNKFV